MIKIKKSYFKYYNKINRSMKNYMLLKTIMIKFLKIINLLKKKNFTILL